MQMNLSRKRRVAIAAAMATAAIAVPAGSAHAATLPTLTPAAGWNLPAATLPAGWGTGLGGLDALGWAGTPSASLAFTGPTVGQVAAVIGPTIITTAPSTFINTNNQVSAGSALSGGQASGAVGATG
jgi:hypothetical protein